MKIHFPASLYIVASVLLLTGCASLFSTGEQAGGTGSSALTTGTTEPTGPEDLLNSATTHLALGEELLEKGDYNAARSQFLQGLVNLSAIDNESTVDPSLLADKEKLIDQLSLLNLRAVRLRDGFPVGEIEARQYQLDFQYNQRVERWLIHWLTNGRRTMESYLNRSGLYIDRVREIIREENLPEDLALLPVIESGYSPMAHSHADAVGTWQFIKSTGKTYNLRIDHIVDERRHYEKATRAACAFFRKLHNSLGSWDLALAAYNSGEYRVSQAISAKGVKDYWRLELPLETMNYVPKFYAAMMIAKDPDYYGFHLTKAPPLKMASVNLAQPVDLKFIAQNTGLNYLDLKTYNPELLGQYSPPKIVDYPLLIPQEHFSQFAEKFAALPDEQKYLSPKKVEQLLAVKKVLIYRVKKGDSLWSIARKYKTTVINLRKWNSLTSRSIIRPGQKIKINRGG